MRTFPLHLPHFSHRHHHYHHHHHHLDGKKQAGDVPKGCLAVMVGQVGEEQRFVIPVHYFNHPLFMQLLKVTEEEYGFDQKGTITIPCHVDQFMCVRDAISIQQSHHHHHHHHVGCFGA